MSTSTSTVLTPEIDQKLSPLARAIRANAFFSGISALVFLLGARPIASWIGLGEPALLTAVGVLLLLYAPVLLWISNRRPIPRWMAWVVIDLDILWVIGSAILVFTDWVPLTVAGKWTVVVLADIVAGFALIQYIGLRAEARAKD